MTRLASIITAFETDLMTQYGHRLLPGHRRALSAMAACRNSLSPRMRTHCADCHRPHYLPHSCGHRACPHCQHHESDAWLQRQLQRQVPGVYFLVTFTLPAEYRALAWRHQRRVYDALMRCSWETLKRFSLNDKTLQGTPGAISVLHTHSRRLDYHPHVHLAVPAAAINRQKRLWHTKKSVGKKAYLFNQRALAKVFRAKMRETLQQAGLSLPRHCPSRWIAHCKAVGQGQKALAYLGRYLYRGVISEDNILACRNGKVTFRFKNSQTKRWEKRTLPGADFLWLLLRHVLPKGFRRTRNFGFLHPNSKRLIQLVQWLYGLPNQQTGAAAKPRPRISCPHCGGRMVIVQTQLPPVHGETMPFKASAGALMM